MTESLVAFCLLLPLSARAQIPEPALPLPHMAPCRQISHPVLPQKWRGAFLMAPFTPTELVLSELVFDGALPAMLVKLYGVRSGSAELFVIGGKTYLLALDGSQRRCEELAHANWTPLPRDLLAEGARCVGEAPVAETPVQWWKTPAPPGPLTDWVWFKSADRSPFRLLFQRASDRLSILSAHALSYQLALVPLSETGLAAIATTCAQATRPATGLSLGDVLTSMQRSQSTARAEIKRLLPELEASCEAAARPRWPDTLAMSLFLTPLDVHFDPVPTEVRYHWRLRSQRTRMFWPAGSGIAYEDALMVAAQGYSITHKRNGDVQCIPALPGTPRPHWMQDAPCTCEARIGGTTPLTPYGPVEILRCPATPPRLFWTWQTLAGRPMTFLVTPASADEPTALIALADYYAWDPGFISDASAFIKPAQCPDPRRGSRVAVPARHSPEPCWRCHLTQDSPR
jgi:hypothetical protein